MSYVCSIDWNHSTQDKGLNLPCAVQQACPADDSHLRWGPAGDGEGVGRDRYTPRSDLARASPRIFVAGEKGAAVPGSAALVPTRDEGVC